MRLRYLAAAGLSPLLLLAMSLPSTSSGATTTPTPATDAAFRSQLSSYLQALQNALNAAANNPHTAANEAPHVQDGLTGLATAEAQVPTLSSQALEAMEGILGQSPTWQQEPTDIATGINSVGSQPTVGPSLTPVVKPNVKPATVGPNVIAALPGIYSDCSGGIPDLNGLFYGYWAAAQVASAANAVASGMPDGVDFAPALIIAGVAYGVANGIAIGLQADLTLGQDCATAAGNTTLENSWPTDPSAVTAGNPNGFTPASSQISVNALKALIGGIQTTLDAIQTTITTDITPDLTAAITTLGLAQGTANNIQTTAMDLQSRTDALLATIGTASDTTNHACETAVPTTCTANGLANTINTRMDTILANTASFQALGLRADIERDLASSSAGVVTLYALPATQGGYLELVQAILTQTINNELADGQSIGLAQTFATTGNNDYAAGKYEDAYKQYALAYQAAVR